MTVLASGITNLIDDLAFYYSLSIQFIENVLFFSCKKTRHYVFNECVINETASYESRVASYIETVSY